MIDVEKFSIRSLWRQLLCNFELDDLDDAMLLIPAIHTHPRYTSAHEPWFQNLLSNLLCDSLQNGNFDWALYVLGEGAQVFPEAAGHAACRGFSDDEKLEIFDAFYENGWNVNSSDEHNIPIFSLIADSEPLVRWFLSHGADPNLGADQDFRPIDRAAAIGTLTIVQLLLHHGARLDSTKALYNVARRRSSDHTALPILMLLLDQHGDADFDIDGVELEHDLAAQQLQEARSGRRLGTLLHGAVESGSLDRVHRLLDRGADPRREDTAGQTPLDLARRHGDTEMERVLLEWLGRIGEERREPWVIVDDFEVLEMEIEMIEPVVGL